MTHGELIDKIRNEGRCLQEISRAEMLSALDIIANDVMSGAATVSHGNTLYSIRFALMNRAERAIEDRNLSRKASSGVL